jgi:hypothetical protein
MRRQLSRRADASDDLEFIRRVAEFVKATDALRIAHADLAECLCWQRAVEAEDAQVAA